MKRLLRSLRIRLFMAGFVAIYLPVLVLTGVFFLTSSEEVSVRDDGSVTVEEPVDGDDDEVSAAIYLTAVALVPLAGLLSWWWSGRAVRPVEEAISIQQELIEETSHELRTPLSVLTANSDVLLAHPEPTLDEYRRGLERAAESAERMRVTLDALLTDARSRARTVDRKPAEIDELVRRACSELRPLAASRSLTIIVDASKGAEARVDATSVERAVNNLLTNAIQHSPTGSDVRVQVTAIGDGVQIGVVDEGDGIPAADQEHIFDRHWRGDDSSGTGLGLAIVDQVARAHGGSVTVTSPTAGVRGTRFDLRLPR